VTRVTLLLPALACPHCGAWGAGPTGRRAVKVVDTQQIGETRRQSAICRKCGTKFVILMSPEIKHMEVVKSDSVGNG